MAYTPVTLAVPKGGTGQVTLTSHGVLVGEGTSAINQVAAGTAGQVLQSGGALADPVYSTATFPATAGNPGTLLRSNGTNWGNTSASYPSTIAANQLLYASGNNAISSFGPANQGVVTTDASGVPSIDTTNFVRQTTGMQMKGNNTNTAPPVGFIGERITANATSVATTSTTGKTITSILLTPGIWDITGSATSQPAGGTVLMQAMVCGISTTDNTLPGTLGVNMNQLNLTTAVCGLQAPLIRAVLSANTTYYLVVTNFYTSTTCPTNAIISATRVG